jgi:hypothetical protein
MNMLNIQHIKHKRCLSEDFPFLEVSASDINDDHTTNKQHTITLFSPNFCGIFGVFSEQFPFLALDINDDHTTYYK